MGTAERLLSGLMGTLRGEIFLARGHFRTLAFLAALRNCLMWEMKYDHFCINS
jgi:hypothetical protein